MKKIVVYVALCLALRGASGEKRFGRQVVNVATPRTYQETKIDDVTYRTQSNDYVVVSTVVYRGTEHYYVEVQVTNRSERPLELQPDFISFKKTGYTIDKSDTTSIAREEASAADARFIPTPRPYVAPTYRTTTDASATSYGNQTSISATTTTTADYSGQTGANFGNAVGNAIAARRFRNHQQTAMAFSQFLATHTQTAFDAPLEPGQSRTIVASFDQAKRKKKPFAVNLKLAGDTFTFAYKE